MVYYLPATIEDVVELAENLRDEDREELRSLGSPYPISAIRHSVSLSFPEAIAARDDEHRTIAIFGVMPRTLTGDAVPWLLATPLIRHYRRQLLTHGKELVRAWLAEYHALENDIPADSLRNKALLRHLGFTFDEPRPNPHGAPVQTFHLREEDV